MKKLAYQVSGILLLVGLSAGPALAGAVYKSDLLCLAGVSGKAKITSKGTLIIKAKGLEPDITSDCEVICPCDADGGGSDGNIIYEEECTANKKGVLKVKAKEALAGETCRCPAVEIENAVGDELCVSGFAF